MHYSLYSHISRYTKFSIKYKRLYIVNIDTQSYLHCWSIGISWYIYRLYFYNISTPNHSHTCSKAPASLPFRCLELLPDQWSPVRAPGRWEPSDRSKLGSSSSSQVSNAWEKSCRQAICRSFGGQELCVKECKRACFWYGAVAEDTVQDCVAWHVNRQQNWMCRKTERVESIMF